MKRQSVFFDLGPPRLYGKAKGRMASTGSSCSFAHCSPWTNTVGADLLIKAQSNFWMFHRHDSSGGSCADEKKNCVSPNMSSMMGSTSVAVVLFFLSCLMVGCNISTL